MEGPQGFQKGHPAFKGCEKGWFKKGVIPKNVFKKGCKNPEKGKKHPQFSRENHPRWKGGRRFSQGYIFILCPNHPFAIKQGYVREHRLVLEKHIGRYLRPQETPHHINEITTDNRIENLILFKKRGYNSAFHKWGYIKKENIIFDGRCLC